MKSIILPIRGIEYRGTKILYCLQKLIKDSILLLELEPDNSFDKNAIKVIDKKTKLHLGYVPAVNALDIAKIIKNPNMAIKCTFFKSNLMKIKYKRKTTIEDLL